MKNIVIFGPPGSGKGTQSDFIIDKYKLTHISTGDVLRAQICAKSPLGIEAKGYINQGKLVPDSLIIQLLSEWLLKHKNSNGFIFDGFPRTLAQAQALKEMLNKNNQDINLMLSLEVDEDELIKRLLKRGEVSGRADDNMETITKRIKVYHEQTAPVIDFYKAENTHAPINGVGDVESITAQICAEIDKI